MRAKIYARVSTSEQAEKGYSIESQLVAGRKLAAEHGCNNPEEYVDAGFSGEFLDRPDMNRLRDDLRAAPYKGLVIFHDPDRMARNLAHQLIITEEIEKAGAQLKFISGDFENTPEGKLFYSIRGAISDFEKEKIKERSMRGKRTKAQQGHLITNHKPLGYDFDEKTRTLSINESEAEIIRTIYELCTIKRIGMRSIAEELNIRGYRTKNGKQFYMAAIYRILKNPMYMGYKQAFRYYDQQIGQKKTKRTVRDREEWIEIRVPAIVTEETWEDAQKVIHDNTIFSKRNSKRRYLLSGILKCGYCGKAMIGVSYPSHGYYYQYYICNARWKDKNACSNGYVRLDNLDHDVWAYLRNAAEQRTEISIRSSQPMDDSLYKRVSKTLKELKESQALIMKWVRERTVTDLVQADKDMKALSKEIALAEATLNSIKAHRPKPGPSYEMILKAETFDQKRAILKDWGVKIFVKRDAKGDVEWAFGV